MAFNPISGTAVQYSKLAAGVAASDHFLKMFASGTTTPISMATDSTGGTLLAKARLNSEGYVNTEASAIFIPHIDQEYKLSLFPTEADADANTNAVWTIDGLTVTSGDELQAFIDDLADDTDLSKGVALIGRATQNHLTVATMTADVNLSDGQFIAVDDYATGNSSGVLFFKAVAGAAPAPDGGSQIDHDTLSLHFLQNFPTNISVKMFGAAGLGGDDTTAIQSACDYYISDGVGGDGFGGRGGVVELGAGDFGASSKIGIPNMVTLRGEANFSSRIFAMPSFPDDCVIELGDGRDGTQTPPIAMFGCRLEAFLVDCTDQSIIGVFSQYINENSGLFNMWVRRSNTTNVHITAALGFPVAQNWSIDELNITVSDAAGGADADTIGLHIENQSSDFRGIRNITTTKVGGENGLGTGILLDRINGGIIGPVHCERTTIGLDITLSNGFSVTGATGHGSLTDLIRVDSVSQEFGIYGTNGQGATNTINDLATVGKTITIENVGSYVRGAGDGTNNNVITSISAETSEVRHWQVNNFMGLKPGTDLTISSGEITVTGSFHTIDTESSASTDDLTVINTPTNNEFLILRTKDSGRVVTVKDGGMLNLAGDFVMDSVQDRLFLHNINGFYSEISRSDNNT